MFQTRFYQTFKVCPCISCLDFVRRWHKMKVRTTKLSMQGQLKRKWFHFWLQQLWTIVCPSDINELEDTGRDGRQF